MAVLLTGFEPFGGADFNPSQKIVEALRNQWTEPDEIIARILPVTFSDAGSILETMIDAHAPRAVLMLGLAESAPRPRLERVALNINEASIADNAGALARGNAIIDGGPLALQTFLDLSRLQSTLADRGHGVEISNHAGTYVCNHIYYTALTRLAGTGVPSLFLHVPLAPAPDHEPYFEAMTALAGDCLRHMAP